MFPTFAKTVTDTTSHIPYINLHSRVRDGYDIPSLYISLRYLGDDEYDIFKANIGREMKERMGMGVNPLDGAIGRTSKAQYMFQYFLKVVSTQFRTLEGKTVSIVPHGHARLDLTFSEDQHAPIQCDTL